jgi:hypothetical protein
MANSPYARSKGLLEKLGYQCGRTEHWNHHVSVRQDLWGFCDLIAVGPLGTLAVQATSGSNVGSRVAKLTEDEKVAPAVRRCLEAGWTIEVWGWRKLKPRGVKRALWAVKRRRLDVSLYDGSFVVGEYADAEGLGEIRTEKSA